MRRFGTLLPVSIACVAWLTAPADATAQWSEVYAIAGYSTGATRATLRQPRPAALVELGTTGAPGVLADGTLLVPNGYYNRVVAISPDGVARRVAGTGRAGSTGDGGPANRARVDPEAVVALPDGGYLIGEGQGISEGAVRRVGPDGIITTIAGSGALSRSGDGAQSGDGGPAVRAGLQGVSALAVAADGSVLIGQPDRVRRVDPQGVIRTVAGTGRFGFSGDGGPAVRARITTPNSLAPLNDGGFLIADTDNDRVRRVDAQGTITSVAGVDNGDEDAGSTLASRSYLGRVTGVAAEADGFPVSSWSRGISHVDSAGSLTTLLDQATLGDFSGRDFAPDHESPGALARTPDGGLAFSTRGEIVYAAPVQPARTGVRIRDARVVDAQGRLTLAATHPGVANITVHRGRRSTVTPPTPVPAGRSSVRIRLPRRSGAYRVRVVLTANGGTAADELELVVGPTLPVRLADVAYDSTVEHDDTVFWDIKCRRKSLRRVDCTVLYGRQGRLSPATRGPPSRPVRTVSSVRFATPARGGASRP